MSHRSAPLAAVAVSALTTLLVPPAEAVVERSPRPIAGHYIVVLADGVARPGGDSPLAPSLERAAADLAQAYSGRVERTYGTVLSGFAFTGSALDAEALSRDARVAYVAEDGWAEIAGEVQSPLPSWGLDRIDQRPEPLDTQYSYNGIGAGVHLYVVDTGIRSTHVDFGGRVDTANGFTAIADGNGTEDCNGHGTHVAGVAGGSTYGVAKGVTLHPVRVLDCGGFGPVSNIIAGVDWIAARHPAGSPERAVVNFSINAGFSFPLEDAVRASVQAGIVYVAAAGNNGDDACYLSPGRMPEVLTVGATGSDGARWGQSNFGTCLDLFAPGVSIVSAGRSSDTASLTMTGTSAAAPHVAGTVALVLAEDPDLTPFEVADLVTGNATPDVVVDPGPGSPNLLLYSAFAGEGVGGGNPIVFSDDFENGTLDAWN